MKRYFSIIGYCMTPFVVSYAFWYCVGAGISASWDTANWGSDLKTMLAIWAALFGFALFLRIERENHGLD
jgi:hypothetical protein